MKITRTKKFEKAYAKLSEKKKKAVDAAISIFYENPQNITLKNHRLHGEKEGLRAISAGGDLRIIFLEKDGYIEVLMLHVGTHNQVYD
ncbi:MAG: type II toxin-antitoxin system YafQ family toxin [Candidatus Peregrinibacteria bacterium]